MHTFNNVFNLPYKSRGYLFLLYIIISYEEWNYEIQINFLFVIKTIF